jgi:hypothetical protein
MSRVVAVTACGLALAACSMSMPSLDFFKSAPPTEVLRVESEPPGADARTSQGQSCRTPCELTVPAAGDMSVSFALNGYEPQTILVRVDAPPASSGDAGPPRLQPNPVYAELQPVRPPAKKKAPVKRKQTVQKAAPAPAPAPAQTNTPDPGTAYPSGFPWPDPQPR